MRYLSAILIACTLSTSSTSTFADVPTNINAYLCAKLDDFTATGVVDKSNQRELQKISKDLGFMYRFGKLLMRYKEPNKVRVEGTVEGTKGVYIVNGTIQRVSVPKIRLNTRRDFGDAPGKRKSLVDIGLISPYYMSYSTAKFVREGSVDGTPVGIFDVRYKDQDADTSHHLFYIDPKTRVILKRDAYHQDGRYRATYRYLDVKQVAPGIWFPTRIEVYNAERKLAGSTRYEDIKVNTGLPDSLFE